MNLDPTTPDPERCEHGARMSEACYGCRREDSAIAPMPPFEPIVGTLHETVPSYEECVRLCVEHHVANNQKRLRELVEEEMATERERTGKGPAPDTTDYERSVEMRVGIRIADRSHFMALGLSDMLSQLAESRKKAIAEVSGGGS